MTAYHTLFTAELVQHSGAHLGGAHDDAPVDHPFQRDGYGRPVLTGTGLAGALIATARRLGLEIPESISFQGPKRPNEAFIPSRWRVFDATPLAAASATRSRSGVAISHRTGAAAHGLYHDLEILPRGTRWPFVLDVTDFEMVDDAMLREDLVPARIAAAVLLEWADLGGLIGAGAARGLGWVKIEKIRAFRLTETHVRLWPRSTANTPTSDICDWSEHARIFPKVPFVSTRELAATFDTRSLARPRSAWPEWRRKAVIEVGPRRRAVDGQTTTWGLDALSVGGHRTEIGEPGLGDSKDRAMARTPSLERPGASEPFIPGSAIRGPLRHELSRQLRRSFPTAPVLDPTASIGSESRDAEPDDAERVFGSLARDSRLLVSDAYVATGTSTTAALLHRHAEDEFTAGTYGDALYELPALLECAFEVELRLEMPPGEKATEKLAELRDLVDRALSRAAHGHLPLGGYAWRGLGWPTWRMLGDWTPITDAKHRPWLPAPATVPTLASAAALAPAQKKPHEAPATWNPEAPPKCPGDVAVRLSWSPAPVQPRETAADVVARYVATWPGARFWAEPDARFTGARPRRQASYGTLLGAVPKGAVLREARVFGHGKSAHILATSGGVKVVEWAEGTGDVEVRRHVIPVFLQADTDRFGHTRGPEHASPLVLVQYWQGARCVAWRLALESENPLSKGNHP